jgi:hypothetical protein
VVSITQRRAFKSESKEFFVDAWQRMCRIGLPAGIDESQKHKIIALNIANLIGILPLRLVLGVNYALAGQWPSAILMAIAFATVSAIVLLRMGGYLSFAIYRQSTILFTFICPILLTFLLNHLRFLALPIKDLSGLNTGVKVSRLPFTLIEI